MKTLFAFLISMSPFGEIKVGIPYAFMNDLDPWTIFIVACLGNLLVFPITMWFMDRAHKYLIRFKRYRRLSWKMARMVHRKAGRNMRKNGFWGLLFFVGLPLPITGAYIGSVASWLFKIDRKVAFASISLGVILAAALLTIAGSAGLHFITVG